MEILGFLPVNVIGELVGFHAQIGTISVLLSTMG